MTLDTKSQSYAQFGRMIDEAAKLEAEIAAGEASIRALDKQKDYHLKKAQEHEQVAKAADNNLKAIGAELRKIELNARAEAAAAFQEAARHQEYVDQKLKEKEAHIQEAARHQAYVDQKLKDAEAHTQEAARHRELKEKKLKDAEAHTQEAARQRAIKIQTGEAAAKNLNEAEQKAKTILTIMISKLLGTNKEKVTQIVPTDGSIRYDIEKQSLTITESGMDRIIRESSKVDSGFKPGNFKFPGVSRESISEPAMIKFFDAIPRLNVEKVVVPFTLSANEIAALVKAAKAKSFEVTLANSENQTAYNTARAAPASKPLPAIPSKPVSTPVNVPGYTNAPPQLVPNRGSPPKGQA